MFRNIRPSVLSLVLALFSALACASCEVSEFGSIEELHSYVLSPSSGLNATQGTDGLAVSVYYRPSDMIVYEMLDEGSKHDSAVDSLRERIHNYYYFIASFSRNSKEILNPAEGLSAYSEILQTLSFRMHDYAMLVTSRRDTISLADFMMDRTYGLSASTDVLLVFARERLKECDWVELVILELGLKSGTLRFRFDREKLDKAPGLDFGNILGMDVYLSPFVPDVISTPYQFCV